jgi:hypothetical protein
MLQYPGFITDYSPIENFKYILPGRVVQHFRHPTGSHFASEKRFRRFSSTQSLLILNLFSYMTNTHLMVPEYHFFMANIFFHNYRRVQSTLVLPESVSLISVKSHRMVLIPNKYILKCSSPSQISKSTFKLPQYKGMT